MVFNIPRPYFEFKKKCQSPDKKGELKKKKIRHENKVNISVIDPGIRSSTLLLLLCLFLIVQVTLEKSPTGMT